MYIQTGEMIPDEFPEDIQRDTVAIKNGYISITPITLNRTNFEAFNALNK
jgi:broad specificity polyphosphatase/5'/3'-nucleotidase SurE